MRKQIIIMAAALMLTAGVVSGTKDSNEVQAASKKVAINKKNFPDKVFRELVRVNYDKNKDKKLSKKEIKKATSFGTASRKKSVKIKKSKYGKYQKKYIKDIKSFKGITKLTNLKTFIANETSVKTVNFKKNKKLSRLEMTNGSLQKLDLNSNKKLKYLYLEYNQLTSLKLNKCKKLVDVDLTGHMVKKLKIYYNKKTEVKGETYYKPFTSKKVKTSFADLNEGGNLDANGNYCIYEWNVDYTACVKKTFNGTAVTSRNIVLNTATKNTATAVQNITAQWQDAQGNFYFVADRDGALVKETTAYIYKVNPQGSIVKKVVVNDWMNFEAFYEKDYHLSLLNQKNGVALLKVINDSEIDFGVLYLDMNKMVVTRQVKCRFEPCAIEGDIIAGFGMSEWEDDVLGSEVFVSKIPAGEVVKLDSGNSISVSTVASDHRMLIENRARFAGESLAIRNNYVYLINNKGFYKAKLTDNKFTQVYGIGKIAGLRNRELDYTMIMKNEKEMYMLFETRDENPRYSLSYNKI